MKLNPITYHAMNTKVVCYSNLTRVETFLTKFHLHLARSSQGRRFQELQADLLQAVALCQKNTLP